MRIIGLVVGFILTGLLVSCLSSGTIECRSEQTLRDFEVYIVEDDGDQYFASKDGDLDRAIISCSSVNPADSLAFAGIYGLDGSVVDMCDKGLCISVSKFKLPYCPREYQIDEDDEPESFIGRWQVAHVFSGSESLYPSCGLPGLYLNFNEDPDTTYATGVFGPSTIAFGFDLVDESKFVPAEEIVVRDVLEPGPYTDYFESQLTNYFRNQDTIYYSIENNILRMSNESGEYGIQFFR